MESRMYATPMEIEEYLFGEPKKPFLLCEYMHCMGNSLGRMKFYMDLLNKYEMYQGGDFDDRPSDYEFSGNGILFADRTAKPALQEVRYYYGLYE